MAVPADHGLFGWWRSATLEGKRAFIAASLGYLLDSFDTMLFALVLAALMRDLSMDASTAGLLGSIMLIASAAGGLIFGVIADRFGRTRALMGSILLYSVFTAACGFARTIRQLAVFRVLLGVGVGGEWASGAALVSETWSAEHRAKALGFMQSAWAVGYAVAAIVTGLVMPIWGWRGVFFVGVLPALFTIWVRKSVKEPEIWRRKHVDRRPAGPSFRQIFARDIRRVTIAVTLMNACAFFAYWGFNLWLPGYLALPAEHGGIGLSTGRMSFFVAAMQIGTWFGYVTFGYASDRLGRRRAYVTYLVSAAVLILVYVSVRNALVLLLLGPVVAFFATGYFSGLGAVTADSIPRRVARLRRDSFTAPDVWRARWLPSPWERSQRRTDSASRYPFARLRFSCRGVLGADPRNARARVGVTKPVAHALAGRTTL